MEFPTAEELEGPLTPTAMGRVADLDSAGMARYAERYGRHMAATAPVRDRLRATRRNLRDQRDSGDREAMRDEVTEIAPVISRLWKNLSKRDKQFYKDVSKTYTKDERRNSRSGRMLGRKHSRRSVDMDRARRGLTRPS